MKKARACARASIISNLRIIPIIMASSKPVTITNGIAINPNTNLINTHHFLSVSNQLYKRVIVGKVGGVLFVAFVAV